jgi:hypothetical protein
VRYGKLTPRILYTENKNEKPHILASIYEIKNNQPSLLVQFKITFAPGLHNDMYDVQEIRIFDPEKAKKTGASIVLAAYKRPASPEESEMMGPPVEDDPPVKN